MADKEVKNNIQEESELNQDSAKEPEVTTSATDEAATKSEDNVKNAVAETESKKTHKRRKKAEEIELEDEFRDERAILKGAQLKPVSRGGSKKLPIFTGMLERFECKDDSVKPEQDINAVVFYKGFRILIPASHMGLEVDMRLSPQERANKYKQYILAMIGSDVDFIVLAVDNTDNFAVGSRKIAMGIKRRQNYLNKYRNTGKSYVEYCMDKVRPIEAKVMAVAGSTVRVDVLGVECQIFARDAAWRYTPDLSKLFCVGDVVKVVIKSCENMADGSTRLSA